MARQTVQTCALAARWRHLWRAVPCLDINERDFTTNLLRGHEFTLLEDFRLHGATVTIGDHWLRHEIGRDAWPRGLRRLRLSNVELQLADLASHISSSRCPALEEARLEKCWFLLTSNIKIASSSLKKLVVHGEYIMDEFEVFKLVIDAPALVSLRLGGRDDQLGILGALSNVTTLHWSNFAVTLLFNEGHENLPLLKFKNLRTLFLGVCRISDDFLGLQQYLWNSPNLQRLTMRHCKVLDFQPTKEVMERHQSYSKDLEHFKCKKLRLCDSDPSVHLLVKFLVGMSSNLPNNKIELTSLKKRKKKSKQSRTADMLESTDASAEPKRPHHEDDGGDAGDDRLSALPDDLLHAILSHLKAQQTVQTCVLSTRWRHLWRAVPCLDIDRADVRAVHGFDGFTANLLRRHDFTSLEDLRLHGATAVVGDRWLRGDIGRDTWPHGLKRLHLSGLELQLNDLASHISSSRCPALEDLQLNMCFHLLTSNAKIISSSLKKLTIVDGEHTVEDHEVFKLFIEAPALVSLRLAGEEFEHILDTTQPHTMPSLVDASIHLPWIYQSYQNIKEQLYILVTMSNVTTLRLSHFAVTLLFLGSHEDLAVFKFDNLTSFSLDGCRINDDFLRLHQYLYNSPNLQKLTLRHCKSTKEVMKRRQSYSKDLAHFNCNNLRLTEIIHRDGDASVDPLVKFFRGMRRNLPNNKVKLISLKRKKNITKLTMAD
uniref:Uncharacterized protein n=1 Tax=Aegilops tauschii TaxID=37682 RepID=M8BRS7_AEGTA